jgi:peptidyl-prolyl cis-trans isomerase D
MLTAFRNFAKSPIATVLFALLILAMAGFGISRYGFQAIKGNEVIRAGSRTVSPEDFRREFDQAKKGFEQQAGQPISQEMIAQNHLDAMVLASVATREAFSEFLGKIGVRPGDKLIAQQIEKIPAFFDAVTGRFDNKTFVQRLAENGLTPARFDQSLRDDMAAQHFVAGLGNGLVLPRAYGALAAIYGLESRDVAYFQITIPSVGVPPPPTDAQLTQFIKDHAAQLRRPEMRVISLVRFTPQAADATAPIDPAELKKRYDFKKDTLSRPETRTIAVVPAKTPAIAQQIATRLKTGEAPAAIAKSLGVEAVNYEDKPQTAIPDHKLAQAAFAMQAGQVSAIQGDLGPAVAKVEAVSPGRAVTLEEARPMLEAEIRKDQATEKVYAATQAYDDAHQKGATLAEAAQKAGAPVVTVGPVTQQGQDQNGQPIPGLNQRILEEAFAQPTGGESELSETGDGEYFAVKVERVIPAAVPPLDEVRPLITRAYIQQEIARRLEAKTNELVARIKKGESLDAVAASAGFPVSRVAGLTRQTAAQHQEIPREVLGRAFAAKPGEVFSGPTPNTFAVGQVSNVRMDPSPIAAQAAEGQRRQMTQEVFRELATAAQTAARTKLKVRADPAKARAAIGLEPEEAPAGKTAPAK